MYIYEYLTKLELHILTKIFQEIYNTFLKISEDILKFDTFI